MSSTTPSVQSLPTQSGAPSTESAGAALDAGPSGRVVRPGDPDWDAARTPWVISVDQRPEAVVQVQCADDVVAVVRSARAAGLGVAAQGTGHGSSALGDLSGTVLIRTGAMSEVTVDAVARTARVGAGAEWIAVTSAAAEHGLTVQAGSSHDVGVTGYVLSGGMSWLARSHGMAANDVLSVQLVTADGEVREVDADSDPDLFWALRGGGGSFGVVTALTLRLHEVPELCMGAMFWPLDRSAEVLAAWRRWAETVPEETATCARLMQFPPMPELPEPMRGQSFVVVEVAHLAGVAETDALLAPLRALGPVMDNVAAAPTSELWRLHMDPPGPVPAAGEGRVLDGLPDEAIDALVAAAGPGSGSPLVSVELRLLGGAVGRAPEGAGAVGSLPGAFACYAVGITPDPGSHAAVSAHLDVVLAALAPWTGRQHYANFVERSDGSRARFHDEPTLARLREVEARYDADDLFVGAHPIG